MTWEEQQAKENKQRLLDHLDTQFISKQTLIKAIEDATEQIVTNDYLVITVIDAHKLLEALK